MIGTKTHPGRRKGIVLQKRDHALLWQLFLMRVATRDHIKVSVGFGSITRVNTRLLALLRTGFVRRFFIGYGAARKALYSLSRKGAQLIGAPYRGLRRSQNELLAADFSVLHQLAINDVYCCLQFGAMPIPGIQFVEWKTFSEPIAETLRLIPDGYVEFKTPCGHSSNFIEVDLGNEALKVWREKAKAYIRLATSGEFTRRFKQAQFRVLVLANSTRRLMSIRSELAKVTRKMFWFAVLADIHAESLFDSVWLRTSGDTHQSLFEQPK